MGPQKRLGIHTRFESPSIIEYLEPLIGNVCHFDMMIFPALGEIKLLEKDITLNSSSLSCFDHCVKQCEQQVQKIIHLQSKQISCQMNLLNQ